ncbi:MAG TPA: c-type cytochrome, partial [Steroidobacteraceae bacterium]
EHLLDRRHAVPAVAVTIPTGPAAVEAGRRLATVYGCMNGCHGDKGQGTVFFDDPAVARLTAPNLTASVRRYNDAQLIGIIRDGVRPDGTSVFIMPSNCFSALTDDDLGHIVAFLRTLPALDGPNAARSLGPLGRLGVVTGEFRTAAQLISEHVEPPPARAADAEHGRYLAQTICAECHGRTLQGDSNPDFTSPNLGVVAAYSAGDFTRLMRTGVAVGDRKLGLMRLRAERNFSHLTDDEIASLYRYLHGLAAPK